jgi:hypothetical protein
LSFELVGAALTLAVIVFLLREVNFRAAGVIAVISAALLLLRSVGIYEKAKDALISLPDGISESGVFEAMLKVTGLTYLYGISADVCRDLGEAGISKALEAVGRVEIMLIAVPYVTEIIMLGSELI